MTCKKSPVRADSLALWGKIQSHLKWRGNVDKVFRQEIILIFGLISGKIAKQRLENVSTFLELTWKKLNCLVNNAYEKYVWNTHLVLRGIQIYTKPWFLSTHFTFKWTSYILAQWQGWGHHEWPHPFSCLLVFMTRVLLNNATSQLKILSVWKIPNDQPKSPEHKK